MVRVKRGGTCGRIAQTLAHLSEASLVSLRSVVGESVLLVRTRPTLNRRAQSSTPPTAGYGGEAPSLRSRVLLSAVGFSPRRSGDVRKEVVSICWPGASRAPGPRWLSGAKRRIETRRTGGRAHPRFRYACPLRGQATLRRAQSTAQPADARALIEGGPESTQNLSRGLSKGDTERRMLRQAQHGVESKRAGRRTPRVICGCPTILLRTACSPSFILANRPHSWYDSRAGKQGVM